MGHDVVGARRYYSANAISFLAYAAYLEIKRSPGQLRGGNRGFKVSCMDPSSRGEQILALSLHAGNPYYYGVEASVLEIAASIKL